MSLPRINRQDEGTPWVNSAPADTSFVTGVPVLMDTKASVEVIYSGLDAADATVWMKASNQNNSAAPRCLTPNPSTLTTANSSVLFNISQMGYSYLYLDYDAGSNTDGAITARLVRKETS